MNCSQPVPGAQVQACSCHGPTCSISATSGPTRWMPSTLSVLASTTTFIIPFRSLSVRLFFKELQAAQSGTEHDAVSGAAVQTGPHSRLGTALLPC